MTDGGPGQPEPLPGLSDAEAAALARRHGLHQVGTRPSLGQYIGQMWQRRGFIATLAQGDFIARHQNNALGLLWSVLNPLLLGLAYWFVFGIVLHTTGKVVNYIAFLTLGLFTFIFISGGLNYGSRSIADNLGLVRSVRFPRAVLPFAVSITQFLAAVPAFLMMIIIALLTGEVPTLKWLLLPVALVVVLVLVTGIALIAARVVHEVRDARNLIPLITRLTRYLSGLFFPVAQFADEAVAKRGAPEWVGAALEYQPVAVSLTMVRETILAEAPLEPTTWIVACGWAVGLFVIGFVVFWQGEAEYGRS